MTATPDILTLPAEIADKVTGFAIDNRQIKPGMVFGAFPGEKVNGEYFIPAAIAAGAIAIVAQPEAHVSGAAHLTSENPRLAFAQLAARFYGPYPATCAAITGTNGKTSTAELTRQIWQRMGFEAASMGTLGVIGPSGTPKPGSEGLTTPDIVSFLENAAELYRENITHLIFEASSHGLSQYRTEGVPLKAAAFTNLTRDHLDYHKTIEAYFAAKCRLFDEMLAADGTAIIWQDNKASGADYNSQVAKIARSRGLKLLTVGPDGNDIHLHQYQPTTLGQTLIVSYQDKIHELHLPLIGGYQAANALTAAALVIACGGDPAATFSHLQHVSGVRGRLERAVVTPSGAPVYVDYAHTPDGLEVALAALRPHTKGRLILVFGCGGDRDRGKRPLMGKIGVTHADITIVTDDNPRTEDPASIRAEIMKAATGAQEIGDRAEAIATAINEAGPGDIVLLAGKGHEQGQIIGTEIIPFDDAEVVRTAAERLGS